MTLSKEAQFILRKWQELQAIRNEPKFIGEIKFFVTGIMRHERHAKCYRELKHLALQDEDALIELLLSGEIAESGHLRELAFIAGEIHWRYGYPDKLRKCKDKLPSDITSFLDWLERVHGW